MKPAPDNFQQQLTALRDEYIRLLPEKLGDIETGWSHLLRTQWSAERIRTLHRHAHSLVGSGATFGFHILSKSARSLEQTLKGLLEHSKSPSANVEHKMEKLLMKLRESVVHAYRELPPPLMDVETTLKPTLNRPTVIKRVYLVEDDESTARDMALQLGHFSYKVHCFQTLTDLRKALQGPAPDAIIMDVMLPDGDGTVALASLARELIPNVPTVFVTVRSDFDSRLNAVRSGAKAYLVKPIDIGELIDKLDRLVGTREADPFRILIIDDSPVLSEYYSLILRNVGMLTRTCNNSMLAMAALEDFNVDLILMDVYMPDCDGFELAGVLRQQDIYNSVPIVFLSSETDLDKQLLALGTGADEFLTKPITPHHLVSAVTSRANRARLLREMMLHDSLTGLLNHTTVKERLIKELAQAKRHKVPVSLAMVDIDHFKSINDRYGHLAGDRVIKSLARLFQQRLRKSDLIGRYGGEEFLIMLYDTNLETARDLIDKLRGDFAELQHQASAEFYNVTFSAGIAVTTHPVDASMFTDMADRALYQAKQDGRNRIVVAEV